MDVRLKVILLWSISMLTVLYSCKSGSSDLPDVEDCEHYDYADCNSVQPFEADVAFNFSISSKNKMVPFEVYKGYVDDNNLYFKDTSWSDRLIYQLPVNEYWSVKAAYKSGGKTVFVIDGGKLKVHSKKVCDSTCWSVDDLELDAIIN